MVANRLSHSKHYVSIPGHCQCNIAAAVAVDFLQSASDIWTFKIIRILTTVRSNKSWLEMRVPTAVNLALCWWWATFILETNQPSPFRSCCPQVALEHAVLNGHILLIRLLLMHGADISCSDTSMDPPNFVALCGCRVPVLEYFLSKGVVTELWNREYLTPIMAAAESVTRVW